MKLQCLIVDDEPPAHKVLQNYIARFESLKLAGNCFNAIEAINFLHKNRIDILFLDIEMPEITGIEMLESLAHPPSVVLTTAYSQFALKGFDLGVTDYLLKPIRFERFAKAVNRIVASLEQSSKEQYIFIKSDGNQHKINFSEMMFLEAFGNYVKIHTPDNVLLTAATLTEMQLILPFAHFIRVHKSHVINSQYISKITGNQIFIGKHIIPIGASYRKNLWDTLNLR